MDEYFGRPAPFLLRSRSAPKLPLTGGRSWYWCTHRRREREATLDEWSSFFQGELGAAAAVAGLLFVSISVNQARILELGRMADRGLEALAMLLLVLVVTTLPLVPGQPRRLLGAEILAIGAAALAALFPLQLGYLRRMEPARRRRPKRMVVINRLGVGTIALAGAILLWRGDETGLFLLPPGILLSFFAAGAIAWVLLIGINRWFVISDLAERVGLGRCRSLCDKWRRNAACCQVVPVRSGCLSWARPKPCEHGQ
jgi:hypothetical protein